jgi:hypothetical protein
LGEINIVNKEKDVLGMEFLGFETKTWSWLWKDHGQNVSNLTKIPLYTKVVSLSPFAYHPITFEFVHHMGK